MGIITDTYTDEDVVKDDYLVLELYDAATLSTNIANQAKEAKKWVNTYVGRETDFTVAELAEIKNEGIVSAACARTACLMQRKRQERSGNISEETKMDCDAAEAILNAWCKNNGIIPQNEKKAIPTSVKIPFLHSEESLVI